MQEFQFNDPTSKIKAYIWVIRVYQVVCDATNGVKKRMDKETKGFVVPKDIEDFRENKGTFY